jgi:hypothetical protein
MIALDTNIGRGRITLMSSLPVTPTYLEAALRDGLQTGDIRLTHRQIGELWLPSGELVASDPFVNPEAQPFKVRLPRGAFAVLLSIAEIAADQRVAYAIVRFKQTPPVAWEMLTAGNQDVSTLKAGEIFGYGVDSGTGCFIDRSAARALDKVMREQENFFEIMIAEMEKTYRHTWSWLDMKFGDGNLIAFSSGYGDGFYASYAGRDTDGEVSAVVTDFAVVPEENSAVVPEEKRSA